MEVVFWKRVNITRIGLEGPILGPISKFIKGVGYYGKDLKFRGLKGLL